MRARAAVTALAFALASLLGVIHEATTRHVVCAAHGELIHADAPSKVAKAAPQDAIGARAPSSTDGDDHCALAQALRQSRIAPRVPVLAPVVASVDDVVALAPRATVPVASALYRTAPKTSPPA
jgi:hypothetical protein